MFNFFGIQLQIELISMLIVLSVIFTFLYFINKEIKKADPLAKPTPFLTVGMVYYKLFKGLVRDNMGKKANKNYEPYIAALAMYLFISNILGLFALPSPTANYSVTLTLALITFVLIQYTKIKTNSFKGYLLGFFQPFPPFVIMNVFGLIAPLISMSLRLFGNITSGSVLMLLFYTFTQWVSKLILPFVDFNFIGIATAPFLHLYFDLFAGFIQTYIFISLTTIFIGIELPQE
ncbi:MAG: F0F1 ATP synthase subunit A [Erysipelotrichaceae bacterium]|nr:F0F1 ATP synthase subunit A [Erysipelotrichaceae bacterium]